MEMRDLPRRVQQYAARLTVVQARRRSLAAAIATADQRYASSYAYGYGHGYNNNDNDNEGDDWDAASSRASTGIKDLSMYTTRTTATTTIALGGGEW